MLLRETRPAAERVNQAEKHGESRPAADVAGGHFADDGKLHARQSSDAQFCKPMAAFQL